MCNWCVNMDFILAQKFRWRMEVFCHENLSHFLLTCMVVLWRKSTNSFTRRWVHFLFHIQTHIKLPSSSHVNFLFISFYWSTSVIYTVSFFFIHACYYANISFFSSALSTFFLHYQKWKREGKTFSISIGYVFVYAINNKSKFYYMHVFISNDDVDLWCRISFLTITTTWKAYVKI